MRRTYDEFRKTLLILSTVTLIISGLVICVGTIVRLSPGKLSYLKKNKEMIENAKVCDYRGLNLCQSAPSLKGFDYSLWLKEFSNYVIIMGMNLMIQAMFGLVGAIFQSKSVLIIMVFIMFKSVALQCIFMDLTHNPLHEFHRSIHEEMTVSFHRSYRITGHVENSYTLGLNLVMMRTKCCGAVTFNEYVRNFTITDNLGVTHTLMYPPACCDFSLRPKGKNGSLATEEENFHFLRHCMDLKRKQLGMNWEEMAGQISGCFYRLHTGLYTDLGTYVLTATLLLVFFQAYQLIFVLMTALNVPQNRGHRDLAMPSSALVNFSTTADMNNKPMESPNSPAKLVKFEGASIRPSSSASVKADVSTTVW